MAVPRSLLVAILLLVVFSCVLQAGTDVMFLIDLTASTPPDVHENHVRCVGHALESLGPGSVFVYGITSASFAKPTRILAELLPVPIPPFETELKKARAELLDMWNMKVPSLTIVEKSSDVLGGVVYSALVLRSTPNHRKVLVICSDMRHSMASLDIEHVSEVSLEAMTEVKRQGLLVDLAGTEVYVLGAQTSGVEPRYYSSLEKFWQEYFKQAKATLKYFGPETNINIAELEAGR